MRIRICEDYPISVLVQLLTRLRVQGLYDDGMFGHSTIDQFIRDLGSHAQTEPAFDLSSYAKAVVLLYFVTGMTDKFKRGKFVYFILICLEIFMAP